MNLDIHNIIISFSLRTILYKYYTQKTSRVTNKSIIYCIYFLLSSVWARGRGGKASIYVVVGKVGRGERGTLCIMQVKFVQEGIVPTIFLVIGFLSSSFGAILMRATTHYKSPSILNLLWDFFFFFLHLNSSFLCINPILTLVP